jgi:hypothetical protein
MNGDISGIEMGDILYCPCQEQIFHFEKNNDFDGIGFIPFFEHTSPLRLAGRRDWFPSAHNGRVAGEQQHPSRTGLGNQQPVKRVFMENKRMCVSSSSFTPTCPQKVA